MSGASKNHTTPGQAGLPFAFTHVSRSSGGSQPQLASNAARCGHFFHGCRSSNQTRAINALSCFQAPTHPTASSLSRQSVEGTYLYSRSSAFHEESPNLLPWCCLPDMCHSPVCRAIPPYCVASRPFVVPEFWGPPTNQGHKEMRGSCEANTMCRAQCSADAPN
ncbi:hypothetical protein LX36DRAFT_160786 [Colletotrichum falcatum]|nr:hypothetical protein LX36DRAFT_160786 [Colletotrichum falcatum]